MNGKRVVIIGGSYYGNQGATLMLKNAMKGIKKNTQKKVIFDVWVEDIKQNKKLCDDNDVNLVEFSPVKFVMYVIPLLFISKVLRLSFQSSSMLGNSCINADLFFDVSGISFVDERKMLFLLYDFLVNMPAFILGKPVIKASQACGPFKRRINKLLAKTALKKCAMVYARGDQTFRALNELGLVDIKKAADLGFYHINNIKKLHKIYSLKKPLIGISVSSVVYQKCLKRNINYIQIIKELVSYIEHTVNGSAIYIPHAIKRGDHNLRNNDVKVIELLMQQHNANVSYFNELDDVPSLQSVIGSCDFLVVSRFHAMVSALNLGIPLMVLGWSHKYQEVMDMFGLYEESIPIEQIDAKSVVKHFKKHFNHRDKIRLAIHNNIENVRESSTVNFELISSILR